MILRDGYWVRFSFWGLLFSELFGTSAFAVPIRERLSVNLPLAQYVSGKKRIEATAEEGALNQACRGEGFDGFASVSKANGQFYVICVGDSARVAKKRGMLSSLNTSVVFMTDQAILADERVGSRKSYVRRKDWEKYRAHFFRGQLFDSDAVLVDKNLIYVMDEYGQIYLGDPKAGGVFNHSFFLDGGPVAAAGEIQVQNGKVTYINNKSGHYYPGKSQLDAVIEVLRREKAISADKFQVELFTPVAIAEQKPLTQTSTYLPLSSSSFNLAPPVVCNEEALPPAQLKNSQLARKYGFRYLQHTTSCKNIPDILKSKAILSADQTNRKEGGGRSDVAYLSLVSDLGPTGLASSCTLFFDVDLLDSRSDYHLTDDMNFAYGEFLGPDAPSGRRGLQWEGFSVYPDDHRGVENLMRTLFNSKTGTNEVVFKNGIDFKFLQRISVPKGHPVQKAIENADRVPIFYE